MGFDRTRVQIWLVLAVMGNATWAGYALGGPGILYFLGYAIIAAAAVDMGMAVVSLQRTAGSSPRH